MDVFNSPNSAFSRHVVMDANVPADLVFDDDPLEEFLYGNEPRGPSPASIYQPAREYFAQIAQRHAQGDDASVVELTSRLVVENHPLSDQTFSALSAVLRLLPKRCFDPACSWDVETLLARLGDLARQHHDTDLLAAAGITRGLWLASRRDWSKADAVWQELRPISREHPKVEALEALVYRTIVEESSHFWTLLQDQGDPRFHKLNEWLLQCELDLPVRAIAATSTPTATASTYLGCVMPSLERLANHFRVTSASRQLQALRYKTLAVGIIEPIAGADHPFTIVCLNILIRLLQDEGDHEAAVRLSRPAVEFRERELGTQHPQLSISLNNLGLSLVCLEQFEEAERVLDRAIRANADSPYPRYWMAQLHNRLHFGKEEEWSAWANYLARVKVDREYLSASIGKQRLEEAERRLCELERDRDRRT